MNQQYQTRLNQTKHFEEFWSKQDGELPRQVTAVVVGAGLRGQNYANFALDFPSRLKIVGVAEPQKHRREKLQKLHDIPDEYALDDWSKLAILDKIADLAIISTQDHMHKDPAIAFANLGYHLLLEKPMAVKEIDCEQIAESCERNKVMAAVGHVMRYAPPCVKIREIIASGMLGEIVTINHNENVLYWHFAHSFVRGNWRNTESSTFSLMAKCCHDIDLIMYWMGDHKCTRVQSFGNVYHFKESQKPEGAASRCLECPVEKDCPYSVQKIYLQGFNNAPMWPMSAVCDIEDHPAGYAVALKEALETGPYGRCVYSCDNDVCDHQMVNMEFDSGTTAVMTMNAFTSDMRRETRVCGTHGELRWDGSSHRAIKVYLFATEERKEIFPDQIVPPCRTRGHDGADFFLMNAVTKAIAHHDPSLLSSNVLQSLTSHKVVFAAEKSRLEKTIETT